MSTGHAALAPLSVHQRQSGKSSSTVRWGAGLTVALSAAGYQKSTMSLLESPLFLSSTQGRREVSTSSRVNRPTLRGEGIDPSGRSGGRAPTDGSGESEGPESPVSQAHALVRPGWSRELEPREDDVDDHGENGAGERQEADHQADSVPKQVAHGGRGRCRGRAGSACRETQERSAHRVMQHKCSAAPAGRRRMRGGCRLAQVDPGA